MHHCCAKGFLRLMGLTDKILAAACVLHPLPHLYSSTWQLSPLVSLHTVSSSGLPHTQVVQSTCRCCRACQLIPASVAGQLGAPATHLVLLLMAGPWAVAVHQTRR
jgi:hypothetical protein